MTAYTYEDAVLAVDFEKGGEVIHHGLTCVITLFERCSLYCLYVFFTCDEDVCNGVLANQR